MKYKILILILTVFLVISINTVSATTYVNGTLEIEGSASNDVTITGSGGAIAINGLSYATELHYESEIESGVPISIIYEDVSFTYTGDFGDIPINTGGPFLLWDGETPVGHGYFVITLPVYETTTFCTADIHFYFDDDFITGTNEVYDLNMYTHVTRQFYTHIHPEKEYLEAHPPEYSTLHFAVCSRIYTGDYRYQWGSLYSGVKATYTQESNFKNDYSVKIGSVVTQTDIFKVQPGNQVSSKYVVRNEDDSLFYEGSYTSSNTTNYETTNNTQKYYIEPEASGIEHLIYSYTPPEVEEDLTPTLTTDKTNYNLSETIEISYTNINEIATPGDSYTLYILYPVIDDYKEYEAKFMQHLYADEKDETFTINTSFLSPQNEYYLGISEPGAFHRTTDHIIMSDIFYVYDDNEYLTTSCNPEGNCYTYNGGDISIYYKINNNSDIIIKDNNENIIHTYYDIIDEGEINFYIPDDKNKLNSYPNWKIYLNNTEYETNYTTNVTVYWSLIATPTPTPIYTSVPIDENVSEQIVQLKEESKPIFDLIYGLSELVVDNPDYDDDNIITENEMNNWFNSLIPIVLILLIIIVYTGLTKKR